MFEQIDKHSDRIKVPGGWLVRTFVHSSWMEAVSCSVHTVFIADPQHTWELNKPERAR